MTSINKIDLCMVSHTEIDFTYLMLTLINSRKRAKKLRYMASLASFQP